MVTCVCFIQSHICNSEMSLGAARIFPAFKEGENLLFGSQLPWVLHYK